MPQYPGRVPIDESYARERAEAVTAALDALWSATDYPEARDINVYTENDLKLILGEWIHVRKAMNALFDKIREAHPDLPGKDPIGGEQPIEKRLADAGDETA
jgi:hypothetical protein